MNFLSKHFSIYKKDEIIIKREEIRDKLEKIAYEFYIQGINAFKNQYYAEALDKFNKAYDTCSTNDIDKKMYKYSRDYSASIINELAIKKIKTEAKVKYELRICELYIHAIDEYNKKYYVEAIYKFSEAYYSTITSILNMK